MGSQQRCVDLVLLNSQKTDELDEVSLAEFAVKGGLTEAQYYRRLIEKLVSGNLMDLLKIEAQADLGDWISENFLEKQSEFVVVFRLSENRVKDDALFCVCSMDFKSDEPRIYVKHALPGFIDWVPPEAKGLEAFEIGLCDMEPRIGLW